jgi:hypothetical protein
VGDGTDSTRGIISIEGAGGQHLIFSENSGFSSGSAFCLRPASGTDFIIQQDGNSAKALTIDTSANATFAGSVKVKNALINNVSVTSATATTVVAIVPHATYNAVFFDFVIKNGTNVRAGTVYACHNGASTPLVEFAETSTVDLGDTSDVTLSVAISGNNMFLQAVTTSSTWTIKSLIRAM